jgi:predicted nucleic acid-binding protein
LSVYIDTSVLAAYYCPEAMSVAAQRLLSSIKGPVISWLTEVELLSALSRKVREQTLGTQDAERIASLFREHVEAGYFTVLPVEAVDYEHAAQRIGRFSNALRALDALHLAVVEREALTLATADRTMAAEAKRIGLKTNLISMEP